VSDHRPLHPSIVREYDIRGIIDETLNDGDARAIGNAFATMVARQYGKSPRICIGYDGRLTSPALESAFCQGLVSAGAQVLRLGLGPTPMLYFGVHHLNADGGAMVTGSHNPPSHNGFKFMMGQSAFYGEQLQQVEQLVAEGPVGSEGGEARELSVIDAYVDKLAAAYRGGSGLSVAWDPGNGAGGEVTQMLSKRLPGRHDVINGEIDGTFPAHHPDPTVAENLTQLQRFLADGGHDLGIALDGDGDRIGLIDDTGRIIWADLLMALLARDVLTAQPGATIIADVKSSQALFDEIARLGGKPIMWRTGHSLIKAKMAESKAPLAGEMSGHLFFADEYYGFDDALYAAVRLLNVVESAGMSLSALRNQLPTLANTPEIRFDCPDEKKFDVVAEVRDRLLSDGRDIDDIDGVRVKSEDGWWLLRASNTQAVLVARCEARDEESLMRIMSVLESELAKSGIQLPG
tara:strand:+ start:2492 stop:3877 length:1386 start_codon:yes stop_codon:yes gene_type:complete